MNDYDINDMKRCYNKPIKIDQAICAHCGKLLTLYWSAQLERYICKKCMDVFLGNTNAK